MASPDKMAKLKEKLRGKGSQLFMSGMALLLVGRLYFFWMETSYTISPSEYAQPTPAALKPAIDEQSQVYKDVMSMIEPIAEFQKSQYYNLARINMFDPKTVRGADALRLQATQFVTQARDALTRGNPDLCKQMLDQAFALDPSNYEGIKLRDGDLKKVVEARISATSTTLTKAPAN